MVTACSISFSLRKYYSQNNIYESTFGESTMKHFVNLKSKSETWNRGGVRVIKHARMTRKRSWPDQILGECINSIYLMRYLYAHVQACVENESFQELEVLDISVNLLWFHHVFCVCMYVCVPRFYIYAAVGAETSINEYYSFECIKPLLSRDCVLYLCRTSWRINLV